MAGARSRSSLQRSSTSPCGLIWAGEFDEGEHWLQRTARALETDTGPGIRLLLHMAIGMLLAVRRRFREALAEYSAAEDLQAQLEGHMRSRVSWRAGD